MIDARVDDAWIKLMKGQHGTSNSSTVLSDDYMAIDGKTFHNLGRKFSSYRSFGGGYTGLEFEKVLPYEERMRLMMDGTLGDAKRFFTKGQLAKRR